MKTTLKRTTLRALRWMTFIAACASMLAVVAALAGKYPLCPAHTPPTAEQCCAGTIDMHALFNLR
ncbi:MAG: hypothetical protein LBM04_11390 [Opitutaceae bacterium]|jgi:hypothetical protein|nr:hypothetical protein [Opitutaceae bacterium]